MQKMIFVVDDNATNLAAAAAELENDYRILTIPSADKMFRLLGKKRPDLILLDIEMPEMDGFEAIVRLKESDEFKDIPVVFLTGHKGVDIANRALELGGLSVVEKPFAAGSLLKCAAKYII
ncbi:MAG: response regulator [Oscillospiraceae bacterium]|nr:response regulator [Oscillospiraceae bacterium]